jgi:uncharacterized membrane protein
MILEKKRKELADLREELKDVEQQIDDCLEGKISDEETTTRTGRKVKRAKRASE